MKEPTIHVLQIEPHKHPQRVMLQNDLDSLQKAVSIGSDYQGLIELVWLEDGALILCNEEGKLNGIEPNRRIGDDILCGVFYVVSEDDEGNLASLSPAIIDKYAHLFWEPDEGISQAEVDASIFVNFSDTMLNA